MAASIRPDCLEEAEAPGPPGANQPERDFPSFSIVVPTYQRKTSVCDAVRALGKLTYDGAVELIVVVDGSTDGTALALMELECPFPLRIIEQINRGAGGARNSGAAEASGDILLFVDDDMICDPDLLEEHSRMYREGADAVIGDTRAHPHSSPGFLSESVRRWIEKEQVSSPLSYRDIFGGQLSVRRSAFSAIGGFDEDYTRGAAFSNEDADLGVRLLSNFKVRHNPRAITRQKYVVTPREYMARATKAAGGDFHFLTKHPQFSRETFQARGFTRSLTRFAYIPLSRLPFVPKVLSIIAVWIAEIALRTPFRSSRLVARFFSGSRAVAFFSAFQSRWHLPGTERLLVLCYHSIRDQSDDPVLALYGVSPGLFADHLDFLTSAGFSFVTPDVFANFVQYGAPLPKRSVLLTFDDGYDELLQIARDVLHPRKIQAIAFVVTDMHSGTNEWDQAFGAKSATLLTAEQLHELSALGVEIGSHSRTHRELPLIDGLGQQNEARGSADDLNALGLRRPRFFAFPFGAVDEDSKKAVREAGYLAAFGCRADYAKAASDRFELPRVVVYANDRGLRFRLKVSAPRFPPRMTTLQRRIQTFLGKLGRKTSAS